jgi:hypothetical protein
MKLKLFIAGVAVVIVSGVSADLVSFQQGDLRADGSLISSSYQTQGGTIRSGTEADNVQTSTSMYIGNTSSGGTPMRGLFGFDLSYIETVVGGNSYTINSVTFKLTTVTANGSFLGASTFSAFLTDSFADETVATWNNPGSGQVAGGNIGTTLSSFALTPTIAGTVKETASFTGANWISAVSNALAGADNTLNFLVKRGTENTSANYFWRPADDEYAGSYGVDARPELIVDVTVVPEPAVMGMLGLGAFVALLIRKIRA